MTRPHGADIGPPQVEEGGPVCIDGHLVSPGDDRVHPLDIGEIAPLRAAGREDADGVEDDEGGREVAGDIDEALVDPLVDPSPPAPHDAHPVLHAEGERGQAVGLRNGDIDDLVRFAHLRVEGPGFQDLPLERHLPKLPRLGEDHHAPRRGGGRGDAALPVAPLRIVDGMVEDLHLFGPGFVTQGDERRHDFGVGRRGVFRRAVPPDIRFHHDDIAPGNEPAHAAESVDGGPRDARGVRPLGDDEIGSRGRLYDAADRCEGQGGTGHDRCLEEIPPFHSSPPPLAGCVLHAVFAGHLLPAGAGKELAAADSFLAGTGVKKRQGVFPDIDRGTTFPYKFGAGFPPNAVTGCTACALHPPAARLFAAGTGMNEPDKARRGTCGISAPPGGYFAPPHVER